MSELTRRVEQIRVVLDARPDGVTIGDFPPGCAHPGDHLPPGLAEVLAVSDGPRAGTVVVLSAAEFGKDYFTVLGAEAIPDEQADDWARFATCNYEPLLVHRQTGEVWWFPDAGVEWVDSPVFEKLADNVESFMTEYVLGGGYLDICVSLDGWARLLADLGWVDPARMQE